MASVSAPLPDTILASVFWVFPIFTVDGCGFSCQVTDALGRGWALSAKVLEVHGKVSGYFWGCTRDPASLQPQEFQSPTLITHHLQSPNHQNQTMSQYFSNNTNALNTINVSNNFTVTDDRSNILAWLSQPDPTLRHHDVRDRRVENLGGWLLKTEEFRGWYAGSGRSESDNAVLFCYGDPGVGKTFIR